MSLPCDLLFHPEFLSTEQLKSEIQARYLNITNLELMQRDDLLEIFHKYCVPFGQRRPRDSGRFKVVNQAKNMSPEPAMRLDVCNNNSNRKHILDNNNRLKPPPDLLSGHFKRIKLDRSVSDVNNSKRKMSIDSTTPATDSPPPKKEKKLITWP